MKEEKIRELTRLLFQTAPAFRKNYRQPHVALQPRLPHHHIFCLVILRQNGDLRMSALAEKLCVSSQQLTRIVNDLQRQGYVLRKPNPENRRVIHISLSPTGLNLLEQYYIQSCQQVGQRLELLPEEDLDSLLYHLQTIAAILHKIDD